MLINSVLFIPKSMGMVMVGPLQIGEFRSVESSISMLRAGMKCKNIILVHMITEAQTIGIMAYHNFLKFQDKQ